MLGITLRENIGVGDKVQFTSFPENYFRHTGEKLVDVSKSWIFDHNPYVVRDVVPSSVRELWNFPQQEPWANPRAYETDPAVYTSNAEVTASRFGIPVVMNRPRLYLHEEFPFFARKAILLHTHGRSNGTMPDHVIQHVIKKYGAFETLFHIGLPSDPDIGIPKIETPTLWDLARAISCCRMLIGMDSGPSWIASCYPDVIVKKLRQRETHGQKDPKDWVPLEIANIHAHWDDRSAMFFNSSEDDVGFAYSYKRL